MLLIPDRIFDKLGDISGEILIKEGVRGLILDIDNTMAPKHIPLPDQALIDWIAGLRKAGVGLYVISNNRMNRVSKFAKALDLPFIHTGLKPFPFSFHRALREMKLPKKEVVAIGDQIFTDICGAHLAGIRAWLVTPIDMKETFSFKLRRRLEKPSIEKYYKKVKKQ